MLKTRFYHSLIGFACYASLHSQEQPSAATLYDVADVISIPIYPRVAAASGQSGELLASILVNPGGRCKLVKIEGGPKILIDGVRKSITGWKFLPRKTAYAMEIKFSFQLLPATTSGSEVVSELFPVLNKVVIKSKRPNLEKGLVVDPPLLPNK